MKKVFGIVLGGCAVAALALFASVPADARCSRASAMGSGSARRWRSEMAKMNLEAGISAKGMKAKGKVGLQVLTCR